MITTYRGKTINLADGWQGAQACTEVPSGKIYCDAGARLQWSTSGTKQLDDWDFRDTASSACVNRVTGGAGVYDDRTLLPDPSLSLGNLFCYDLAQDGYPTGGNWNDKADYIEL
ncbi:hypothetical protein [Streptomyces sp. NBC_01190]|uniref:hypothetical protein n=1 Tax=Streptomyces sp. NBC_01190 TaxID=2903767 RepID=UPI00386A5ED5|nr:hypothetical protein OG519_19750 [Streptomyces sp. NBC_01190]